MNTDREWDERFMLLAHHLAHWSKERGRRVGAVIVGPDREIRATGYNSFPRGVDDTKPERHDRASGAKYLWSSHAERNAIYHAARIGLPLAGSSIYVPWFPCVECAKAIIQSGLIEVIGYEPDFKDAKWGHEFLLVREMLSEANIKVRFMNPLAQIPNGGE